MKKEYNSRQRKIYNDYNGYSTDSLLAIIKKKKEYIPEVTEVIYDILSERNIIFPSEERAVAEEKFKADYRANDSEQIRFSNEDRVKNNEVVRSFVKKLNEKSADELFEIVARYIDYQPETVEAALFLLVEKGTISYELKEKLSKQIESNFADHSKRYKQYKWESNNAFLQYVSRFSDDEIYNYIEDPKGIVIDFYHAILSTAKERQLISEEDFAEYYKQGKAVPKTRHQIRKEMIDEIMTESFAGNEQVNEAELEAEIKKYWKCPSCNEMVNMELNVCWNCQTEIPETIVHPDRQEVIKEIKTRKVFSPVRTGFILIACGAFIVLISLVWTFSFKYYWIFRDIDIATGIIFALAGVGFIIYGLFFYLKEQSNLSKQG
jgi:hypothetical protein